MDERRSNPGRRTGDTQNSVLGELVDVIKSFRDSNVELVTAITGNTKITADRVEQIRVSKRTDRFVLVAVLVLVFTQFTLGFNSRHLIHQINDCINTKGQCYQKSQENQGHIISLVIDQNQNGYTDFSELQQAQARIECEVNGTPAGDCKLPPLVPIPQSK